MDPYQGEVQDLTMSATVWFVIPAIREVAFRSAYLAENIRGVDNQNQAEEIGQMIVGKAGNLMTGTIRMSEPARQALLRRHLIWLEIHTEFPPLSSWESQEIF